MSEEIAFLQRKSSVGTNASIGIATASVHCSPVRPIVSQVSCIFPRAHVHYRRGAGKIWPACSWLHVYNLRDVIVCTDIIIIIVLDIHTQYSLRVN